MCLSMIIEVGAYGLPSDVDSDNPQKLLAMVQIVSVNFLVRRYPFLHRAQCNLLALRSDRMHPLP